MQRLDGNSGMTVVSAAVRQVEGQDKFYFMIMVPTEVVLKPGMRATFVPTDLWDKAVKGEQVDEKRLKEFRLDYTICHPGGCNAEIEASPELISSLKSSGGFMVTFLHIAGQRAVIPVALGGFDAALSGQPVDNKAYTDARRQLMTQIAQRQREIFEEQKKQYEEQQKKGGATRGSEGAGTRCQEVGISEIIVAKAIRRGGWPFRIWRRRAESGAHGLLGPDRSSKLSPLT